MFACRRAAVFRCEIRDACWYGRETCRAGRRAAQEGEGGTADAALAWSHPNACVELRFAWGPIRIDGAEAHVLTPTDDSLVGGEAAQLGARHKRAIHRGRERAERSPA